MKSGKEDNLLLVDNLILDKERRDIKYYKYIDNTVLRANKKKITLYGY